MEKTCYAKPSEYLINIQEIPERLPILEMPLPKGMGLLEAVASIGTEINDMLIIDVKIPKVRPYF